MQLRERVENSALSVSLLLINSCYEFLYFKFIDLISLIYFLYNGIKKKKENIFLLWLYFVQSYMDPTDMHNLHIIGTTTITTYYIQVYLGTL